MTPMFELVAKTLLDQSMADEFSHRAKSPNDPKPLDPVRDFERQMALNVFLGFLRRTPYWKTVEQHVDGARQEQDEAKRQQEQVQMNREHINRLRGRPEPPPPAVREPASGTMSPTPQTPVTPPMPERPLTPVEAVRKPKPPEEAPKPQ